MGLGILMAVVALPWASGYPSLSCGTVFFWEWVGLVSDLEGEVSNSSQFHSSRKEFASSRLRQMPFAKIAFNVGQDGLSANEVMKHFMCVCCFALYRPHH